MEAVFLRPREVVASWLRVAWPRLACFKAGGKVHSVGGTCTKRRGIDSFFIEQTSLQGRLSAGLVVDRHRENWAALFIVSGYVLFSCCWGRDPC